MVFGFPLFFMSLSCVDTCKDMNIYISSTTQPVILFVDFGVQIKRESPTSGSWNIQEELRRVRSKATEEMLRSPSSKFDWSSLATGSDYKTNLSSTRFNHLKIPSGDKIQHAVKPIDKSMYWSADNTVTHNLSGTHFWSAIYL